MFTFCFEMDVAIIIWMRRKCTNQSWLLLLLLCMLHVLLKVIQVISNLFKLNFRLSMLLLVSWSKILPIYPIAWHNQRSLDLLKCEIKIGVIFLQIFISSCDFSLFYIIPIVFIHNTTCNISVCINLIFKPTYSFKVGHEVT